MGAILGGGNSEAKKAAAASRAQQAIANDRQLAELRANEQRSGAMRRNPRGRRLFSDDSKSTLS
ncbi:hypothetical protein GGQ99_000971 [Aminobacter niigataensis]|uniref:Uncharacterized protein n=1 Tax=Aminobacter niigataensis TaxID=83265 RepID=A0ABR6KXK1_9HYPH|nr:hypothetical protein [Aminobacter niigataensis]MBB4649249.1 hypothetical protein [Aminobacter niigataensis]